MMRDRPDAATLRDLARDVGQDPFFVNRALEIAEREVAAGDQPWDRIRDALVSLMGGGDDLWQKLAGEIRAGIYDLPRPDRTRVRSLLWAVTVQKLRESNPDFLAGLPD